MDYNSNIPWYDDEESLCRGGINIQISDGRIDKEANFAWLHLWIDLP